MGIGVEIKSGKQRAPSIETVALGQTIGGEDRSGYEACGVCSANRRRQLILPQTARASVSFEAHMQVSGTEVTSRSCAGAILHARGRVWHYHKIALLSRQAPRVGGRGKLMTSARRAGKYARARAAKTAREVQLIWRRRPKDRIIRWIGTSSRKLASSAQANPAEPAAVLSQVQAGNVVVLTWAQTYGRPARLAQ